MSHLPFTMRRDGVQYLLQDRSTHINWDEGEIYKMYTFDVVDKYCGHCGSELIKHYTSIDVEVVEPYEISKED